MHMKKCAVKRSSNNENLFLTGTAFCSNDPETHTFTFRVNDQISGGDAVVIR